MAADGFVLFFQVAGTRVPVQQRDDQRVELQARVCDWVHDGRVRADGAPGSLGVGLPSPSVIIQHTENQPSDSPDAPSGPCPTPPHGWDICYLEPAKDKIDDWDTPDCINDTTSTRA